MTNNASQTEGYAVRGRIGALPANGYYGRNGGFAPALPQAEIYRSRSDAEAAAREWAKSGQPAELERDSLETVKIAVDAKSGKPIPSIGP